MGSFSLTLKEAMEYVDDIGLNDYPIFDETYREVLNKKIIDNYLNREIAHETISIFTQRMKVRMANIMPKYNAIYREQAKGIDPFITFRSKTDSTQDAKTSDSSTETSSTTQDSTNKSKARAMNSSFPQQMLQSNGDYATDAADTFSDGSSNATVGGTGNRTGVGETSGSMDSTTEGFSGGSMADLLANYADAFINTDLEIINELGTMFMLIWDNGDSFTRNPLSYYYGGMF